MYLSKQSLMCLFFQMRFLYPKDKVQDQGGTQFFSELRHFLALDEFVKTEQRICDTTNRNDKKSFIFNVGRVVLLSDPTAVTSDHTKNFFNDFGDSPDFNVGNNFFVAGAVYVSRNSVNPVLYPAKNALIKCEKAKISLADNAHNVFAHEYLKDNIASFALLFLWLNRNTNIQNPENVFEEFLEKLKNVYSQEMIRCLKWETDEVRKKVKNIFSFFSLDEKPAYLKPNELVIDDLDDEFEKKVFSVYLEIKTESQVLDYKKHCVDVCEFWLDRKLVNNTIGNLFRYRDPQKYEIELERIKKIQTFSIVNDRDESGRTLIALNHYLKFLKYMPHDAIIDLLNQLRERLIGRSDKIQMLRDLLHEVSGRGEGIPSYLQTIYYGAPGTGKSHKIDYGLLKDENGNSFGLKMVGKEFKFRTTFHPDYDYAQFVGAYKPKSIPMNQQNGNGQNNHGREERKITYEFAPQVFAKAYVKAWTEFLKPRNPETPMQNVYLVIEEINRGNCAQIFGDIFQLLDRKNGHSEYPVDVDADFAEYIRTQLSNVKLNDGSVVDYWKSYKTQIQTWCCENIEGEESCDVFCKIALPPNLNILATMNTSDQSLFPMDSAFKRRFDWEYVPIKYEKDATCSQDWNANEFEIIVGASKYKWLKFLYAVNKNVYEVTKSEDKEMGEFFIKPKKNNAIEFKEFRSKVLFYLWDSVYKDEEGNSDAEKVFYFKNGEKPVTFQMLFEGSESDQQNLVNRIMQNLGIPVVPQESNSEELDDEAPAEGHVAQVDGGEATAQHENLVSENAVLEDAEELDVDHQEG